MKKRILAALMTSAALLLSMGIHAKGPPPRAVLLKDAEGIAIGRVIGMETSGWPYVLTDQGYRTLFRLATGRVYLYSPVFYQSTDCTGVAYVRSGRYLGTVFSPTSDDELAYAGDALLYSPSDAQLVSININSTLDESLGCQAFVLTDSEGYPSYQNDPGVTGINNTAYPARLLIE